MRCPLELRDPQGALCFLLAFFVAFLDILMSLVVSFHRHLPQYVVLHLDYLVQYSSFQNSLLGTTRGVFLLFFLGLLDYVWLFVGWFSNFRDDKQRKSGAALTQSIKSMKSINQSNQSIYKE